MPDGLAALCVPAFAGQMMVTLSVLFHPERKFPFRIVVLWLLCALPILAAAWRDADFTLALGECVLGAAFACVWKR